MRDAFVDDLPVEGMVEAPGEHEGPSWLSRLWTAVRVAVTGPTPGDVWSAGRSTVRFLGSNADTPYAPPVEPPDVGYGGIDPGGGGVASGQEDDPIWQEPGEGGSASGSGAALPGSGAHGAAAGTVTTDPRSSAKIASSSTWLLLLAGAVGLYLLTR